jgi:hypothetical protein
MKAKDYIIIGGAIALFLLWKNKQKVKASTTTGGTTTGGTTTGGTTTGGTTTGGTTTGGTTTGTSQVTSFPTPTSNEPEQVNGLGLPIGMDLPVLTAGTGIPTEVAVQQGGVVTTPTPAIVSLPILTIEESLQSGGITPIVKPFKPYSPIYETTELPYAIPNIHIEPTYNPELQERYPNGVEPRVKPTLYMDMGNF